MKTTWAEQPRPQHTHSLKQEGVCHQCSDPAGPGHLSPTSLRHSGALGTLQLWLLHLLMGTATPAYRQLLGKNTEHARKEQQTPLALREFAVPQHATKCRGMPPNCSLAGRAGRGLFAAWASAQLLPSDPSGRGRQRPLS